MCNPADKPTYQLTATSKKTSPPWGGNKSLVIPEQEGLQLKNLLVFWTEEKNILYNLVSC